MPILREEKTAVIERYARQPGDTGSAEVQVALLSQRIDALTGHLQGHPKDVATRRGLVKMVARRNSLLEYLRGSDSGRYSALVDRLGLRG